MNLAHELPSVADVDSPEPEPRAPHRRKWQQPRRPWEAPKREEAFVPEWADKEPGSTPALPLKPPGHHGR